MTGQKVVSLLRQNVVNLIRWHRPCNQIISLLLKQESLTNIIHSGNKEVEGNDVNHVKGHDLVTITWCAKRFSVTSVVSFQLPSLSPSFTVSNMADNNSGREVIARRMPGD